MTTLPSWGEDYEVSFQMWVESFSGPSNIGGWSQILRFTTNDSDVDVDGWNDEPYGSRIPAVFVNSRGYMTWRTQLGNDKNFGLKPYIPAKTWIEVIIKQYAEDDKVILLFCSIWSLRSHNLR